MHVYDKVHIEISNICNLQCSFCPEVVRHKKMMEIELFESIIEQVAPITRQVAFHLMGDPLVHPKLHEFVEICARFEVRIFMVTNGVLLREVQTELLLHSAFRQVNFSLHSFFDNYPERDPRTYLERIFAYTERALVERPDLYINYRLWNLEEALGASSRNVEMLERVAERFGVDPPKQIDVRKKKSYRLRNRLYLHFDTEFTWPAVDLPILGERGTCYGLGNHFGILADGTVVPCCLDKEGNIPLGDLNQSRLADILSGARAQSMLKGFRSRQLVEDLCQRCQYIERFGR
jgi:radical SAM protein with 4Fe4S-binding SPASM domain